MRKMPRLGGGYPLEPVRAIRHQFIDAQRRDGVTTYVHCLNGVSRSGMVVTAYLYEKRWTRDQALAFVRSKRPITRPNPAFMELLLKWEAVVHEQSGQSPR